MSQKRLIDQIRAARLRLIAIGVFSALLLGCVAGIGVVAFGVWCDLVWDLPAVGRIVTLAVALATATVFFFVLLTLTVLRSGEKTLARALDRAAASEGETLTGISLLRRKTVVVKRVSKTTSSEQTQQTRMYQENLTDGLAELAIATAGDVAGRAKLAEAVPARPAVRSGLIMLAVCAILGLLFLAFPDAAATQWRRFVSFSDDAPPYSRLRFDVEPKGVSVRYGEEFDVSVTVSGGLVDQVELVLENQDGTQETLPMFSAEENHWRTTVARVTQEADYFVRTRRARSERYHLDVILVPRIEAVHARVEWPSYTNRAAYEGPVPKGGIVGPLGTRVTLSARSNRPLCEKSRVTLNLLGTQVVHPMQPGVNQPNEVVGQFEITDDGSFEIRLVDTAGNESGDTYSASITVLSDTRPFVRLIQPREHSFATPSVTVQVDISATDDFGISRLSLYRSLNDSRPLPYTIPLDAVPRCNERRTCYLPLAEYGLEPGDVIRLFARVEDNNPAGARGSESRVAEITIISQEEFEEYLRAEKGAELLTDKYNQVSRRMERLLDELEKLDKELSELKKGGKESAEETAAREKQIRERLAELEKRLFDEVEAMKMLADHPLPYEMEALLTKALREQIEQLTKLREQTEKLLGKDSPTEEEVQELLKKMLEELRQSRGAMQQAMAPLKWIEAVMPLMIDQERYLLLAAQQKELAKRMKAFEGKDNPDDPKLKVRMQELQEEQKQIGEALSLLLADIQLHAANLPEIPELEKLRWTAIEFADAVNESDASETIEAAVRALAEFQGTEAAKQSQQASDILEKFISKCEGMGEQASNCPPSFQPCLSQMESTMQQLLKQMLGGLGNNGGGGYGMRGPGSRSTGLYGQMPGMPRDFGGRQGAGNSQGDAEHAYQDTDNPDQDTWSDVQQDVSTSGDSEATVPVRYQRRVGTYFQRILEGAREEE